MSGNTGTYSLATMQRGFVRKLKQHSALNEKHELTPDIYEPLFDWIFQDERFRCWQLDESKWQLRCVGAPGSGKTTLSAFTARKLRGELQGQKEAVALIFIQEDVTSHEASFVEDILASIFHQFCTSDSLVEEDSTYIAKYKEYLEARDLRQRSSARIKLIRYALHARLYSLERAFLIIDGVDRCSPALDLFLEDELSKLQTEGVKIMVTSRIPCLREPVKVVGCDVCQSGRLLNVFWRCSTCIVGTFDLCYECKSKEIICKTCGPDNPQFRQPYDHIDLEISPMPFQVMAQYIGWDLQNEHGNLGLSTITAEDIKWPPLSTLGADLTEPGHEGYSRMMLDSIAHRAFGNISVSRLILEDVHNMHTIDEFEAITDRLPQNFIAMFDAIIESIEQQPRGPRELGLKSIAAMVHCPLEQGVEFADLEKWLQEHASLSENRRHIPHRSLEEILHATKGLLVVQHLEHRPLQVFHKDFYEYARESYHESLVWAHAQLQFGRFTDSSKVKRSQTGFPAGRTNSLISGKSLRSGTFDPVRRLTSSLQKRKTIEFQSNRPFRRRTEF